MSDPKTQARRAKAAFALSKKLEAAAGAMKKFIDACHDDGDRYPYADDDRVTLRARMLEYANYAEQIHERHQSKTSL